MISSRSVPSINSGGEVCQTAPLTSRQGNLPLLSCCSAASGSWGIPAIYPGKDFGPIVETRNPTRMDYQRKYEEIVADYNREKDRTTIEETFRRLVELVNSLDEEQKRATREGLREDELALFDLLQKDGLDKTSRERVKQASRELLTSIKARLAELDRFWEKEQTKADVEVFISTKYSPSCPPRRSPPKRKRASPGMSMPTSGSRS